MRLPRLMGQVRLIDQCLTHGVAFIPVPADGDCLAWSLRYFMQDRVESARSDFTSKAARYASQTTRSCLKGMWEEVKDVGNWQHFFLAMYSDVALGPTTPKKSKKKAEEPVCIDLRTPPEKPKGKVTKRVDETKAVPFAEKPPSSPTLKVPGQKNMENLMDPGVPDLDAYVEVQKQKVPEDSGSKVPPASFSEGSKGDANVQSDLQGEMDEGSDDGGIEQFGKNRKTRRTRECKKRTKTKALLELQALKGCLARYGMTYATFQTFHIRMATVKKAATCEIEGWQPFCRSLQAKKEPLCKICVEFLRLHKVEMEEIERVLAGVGLEVAVPPPPMPPPTEKAEQPEDSGYEVCTKYVRERDPDIELIIQGAPGDQAILRYRCRVCRTKGQPKGKVNLLGKPVMKRIKYLLDRHLESDFHVGRKVLQQGGNPQPDGDVFGQEVIEVDCEGFSSFDEQDFHDLFCIVLFHVDHFPLGLVYLIPPTPSQPRLLRP